MLLIFNAGYISFIIITVSAIIYAFYYIKNFKRGGEEKNVDVLNPPVNVFQLIIISLTGALCSSLAGSTIWQGNVINKKAITLENFGELIGEYFVSFLVISVSSFILLQFKNKLLKWYLC